MDPAALQLTQLRGDLADQDLALGVAAEAPRLRRQPVDLAAFVPSAALAALVGGGTARLGEKTRQTAAFLIRFAALLDLFAATGAEVAATAALLGLTTGACSKLLLIDDRTARAVNQLRAKHGLRPMR